MSSQIIHLLPFEIPLNWSTLSAAPGNRTLIHFTVRETELRARYLHVDAGAASQMEPSWRSLINILSYHKACWYIFHHSPWSEVYSLKINIACLENIFWHDTVSVPKKRCGTLLPPWSQQLCGPAFCGFCLLRLYCLSFIIQWLHCFLTLLLSSISSLYLPSTTTLLLYSNILQLPFQKYILCGSCQNLSQARSNSITAFWSTVTPRNTSQCTDHSVLICLATSANMTVILNKPAIHFRVLKIPSLSVKWFIQDILIDQKLHVMFNWNLASAEWLFHIKWCYSFRVCL